MKKSKKRKVLREKMKHRKEAPIKRIVFLKMRKENMTKTLRNIIEEEVSKI